MGSGLSGFVTRQRLRRWATFATVCIVVWMAASFAVAYRLTRRPRPWFAEPAPSVEWGPLESVRIATSDGQTLGAWYAAGEDEAPSVLLLHGRGGSRGNCLSRAGILSEEAGCAVLLLSLRSHGDSTGHLNDIGYSARHDVVAAVEFLEQRRPGRPVVVLGVSMGAAAALFASEELGEKVQGYILDSPYRDLETAVWNRTKAYLPPVLDLIAYAGLRIAAPLVLPDFEAIAPVRAARGVPRSVPILILAGTDDPLARTEEALAIRDETSGHATVEIFPKAGHHGLVASDPDRYRRLVLDFCDQVRTRNVMD